MKLRDQKQLDFEELSDYLQQTIAERERTLHPRSGDNSTYNITGYFTGKINEVRGADADKIKREKVLRLDDRIREVGYLYKFLMKSTKDRNIEMDVYLANIYIKK